MNKTQITMYFKPNVLCKGNIVAPWVFLVIRKILCWSLQRATKLPLVKLSSIDDKVTMADITHKLDSLLRAHSTHLAHPRRTSGSITDEFLKEAYRIV